MIAPFGPLSEAPLPFPPNTNAALEVVFVGNYPPRKCGIATFTHDLHAAYNALAGHGTSPIVAINDTGAVYDYPPEVVRCINEALPASYEETAQFINRSDAKVVCLQHEYGIFGGIAGSHILAFLQALEKPVVTTLHTILRDPSPEQRQVMESVIRASERVVVMTERGRIFLRDIYGAPSEKIDLIAHGIHDVPFENPDEHKERFSVKGRLVLLTFGLLSPNKGIEHVLKALPAIAAEFPETVYLILGQTHPNLLREQGESYRRGLEQLAENLGVSKHVIFLNRFAELQELKEAIAAADVYLTPYLHEQQIVSGALAYAYGAGKAVVSTPYWHAAELLSDGRGVLVPFGDSQAIAREVRHLLRNDVHRLALCKRAYEHGRDMIWSRAAFRYAESFRQACRSHSASATQPAPKASLQMMLLPAINTAHLRRMTDSTGMLQHALIAVPNRDHGYCTDDNARALLLMLRWNSLGQDLDAVGRMTTTYASFLAHAFRSDTGRFRNFLSYDRHWLEEEGSEDSHGRALRALGTCVNKTGDRSLLLFAEQLFLQALPSVEKMVHPRTWAFALLGINAYLAKHPTQDLANRMRVELTGRLMTRFAEHTRGNWTWLADDATYDNAQLPQALILSGSAMADPKILNTGLRALRWLVKYQTAESGHFQPIGSFGFCNRHGARAFFDQQPIEAQATVDACLEAYQVTNDSNWLSRAQDVFGWFLGRNDLGLSLYDAATGGCRDALHADRANENQGAESTLAFHLALAGLCHARVNMAPTRPGQHAPRPHSASPNTCLSLSSFAPQSS